MKQSVPKGSMYVIFTYIYHKNQPNVAKYTIYMDPTGNGMSASVFFMFLKSRPDMQGHLLRRYLEPQKHTDQIPNRTGGMTGCLSGNKERETGLF